jgi:hypothetical protein
MRNPETMMTQWFIPKVTCLPVSYVLIIAIHPLKGSRVNRHHTPNPQLGAAQPTQDGDPQVMSNSLDYLLALSVGKVKNPSQLPRSKLKTSTFLRSTILAAPSHLDGGKHQDQQAKSAVKHNHQVPLDAITQSNALGCSPISPNNESNKQGEWERID